MENSRLFVNAIITAAHVVVNTLILLILYRFALSVLGVERLGVWSLLLATASAGTIFQTGFQTSVIKFVAKYVALEDERAVAKTIETSVISVGLFHGVFLICLCPLGKLGLGYLITGEYYMEGIAVLPYVLIALWLILVGYVYQSALDGYQLYVPRKLILIVAGLVQLAVAFLFITPYGVMGLAYAQIVQGLVTLFGTVLLVKRRLPILHIIPRRFVPKVFWEMFRYSARLQVISLLQMIVDPITKAMITKFGGLSMTGYYDLSVRLVFQVREMLVQSTEVLLPAIATLAELNRDAIRRVFSDAYSLSVFLSVPCFTLVVLCAPLISVIWLGSYKATFVDFTSIVALGLFFNSISSPAKIVQIAVSRVRWIVIATGILVLVHLVLGACLGAFYGGRYVAVSFAIAQMISGVIIILAYHMENGIPLRSLIVTEHFWLFVGAGVALSVYYEMYRVGYDDLNLHPTELAIIVAGVGLIVVGVPAWFHPVRKRLTSYAARRWFARRSLNESL